MDCRQARSATRGTLLPLLLVLLCPPPSLVRAQNTAKYHATLLGSEVIPPVNTNAHGTADFTFSQHDRSWTCDYSISVFNLSNINTVEAHQAPRASNGDLVYYLYGPVESPSSTEVNGVLVTGTIDKSQLKGPLRNKDVKDLKDRADDGDLYVLVVNMQYPNGALRGQVVPA
ncbi:hypothetical protein COCOBI_08-0930 [Coccomyxa sp. Obi]|nr:hypothetical protein COCOBI_08-0930 [Coccomyxa sp. Obi]